MYKRGDIWWFKVKGIPYSSGTSDEARAKREEARIRLQQWERERFGVKIPRSWVECVAEWAKRKSGKASWKDDQSRLRWWDQWLGSVLDVRAITRAQIDKVMRESRGAASSTPSSVNATANRYVALVSGILNMARSELEWIDTILAFIYYLELSGKEDWITPQQWITLKRTLPPHLIGPAQFSLATGLRQAKVMSLRWDQIDLAGRWMSFLGTANKLGNVIPLNDTAMQALQMARGGDGSPRHLRLVISR